MRRPRWRLVPVVLTLAAVGLVAVPSAAQVPACGDVFVLGARGAGQDPGDPDQEVQTYFRELRTTFEAEPGLTVNYRELGDGPYTSIAGDTYEYPAVPIGFDNLQAALNSADAEFELVRGAYDASLETGVNEAVAFLDDRALRCPDERFVLMGYSQGAHVIGTALFEIDAFATSQIVHVSLLADPKLDHGGWTPEGEPVSCRERPSWVRGTIECTDLGGVLEPRFPYLPDVLVGRVASWCQDGDIICTGDLFGDRAVHSDYQTTTVPPAANEAALAVDAFFDQFDLQITPIEFANGLPTGLYVAFVIDTTGSMADDIDAARARATEIADRALEGIELPFGIVAPGNVALVEYRDYGDPFAARVVTPFTRDRAAFVAGLDSLTAQGGGDLAEAVLTGLFTAFDELDWGLFSRKAAILIGDAPAKNPEPVTGYTYEQMAQRAEELDPVNVFPVSLSSFSRSSFQQIADLTDGELFTATADNLADVVIAAITELALDPVAVMQPRYLARPGQQIVFSARGSFDIDAELVAYRWDFDDDGVIDAETAEPTVRHTYTSSYEGLAKVTVVSSDGGIGTATAQVTVADDVYERLRPAPPTDVVATATDEPGAVTVAWEPSATPDVVGYRIYTDDGTFVRPTLPGDTSVTLSGLEPGRQLRFEVVTHGTAGLSRPAESNGVTVPGGTLDTDIDIRPGSDDNPVNLKSNGVLPVAVLGGDLVDVASLDPTTIMFGPSDARPAHDLSRPGVFRGHLDDVDGDGRNDLVVHFSIPAIGFDGTETQACVRLRSVDGQAYEGCDRVRFVGG